MSLKKNKQIALIAFTILFLLGMATSAWALTEDLIPTSFATTPWSGSAADIDDPTVDTTDFVSTTGRNDTSSGNSFSDPVSVQSGDTINSVTAYMVSQEPSGPEYTQLVINCTSGSDTHDGGLNSTWTTESFPNTTCVNYSDLAGATFTLTSRASGQNQGTSWEVAEVWLRIDYTPQATTTTTTTVPQTTTTTTVPQTTTTTTVPQTTTTTTVPQTTTTTTVPQTTTTTTVPQTTTTTTVPQTTTTTTVPQTTTTTTVPQTTTTTTVPQTTTTTTVPQTTTTTTTTTPTSTTTTTIPTYCGEDRYGAGTITPDITVCASGCDYTTISAAFGAASPGNVICVKDGGNYGGFTFPTTGITLMSDSITTNRAHLTSTVTFSDANGKDPYSNSYDHVLDGFIIDSSSPSMYLKGWCDSSSVTIGNKVQVKYNLFDGGGKPAIKWEGGCPTIGPGNTFRNKLRTALRIYTNAGYSGEAAIIQGNEFYGNGIDGGTKTAYAQIHTQTDATAGRYILFKDNTVRNAAYSAGFGIATGSDDNLYLTGNEVHENPFAGFKLGTWGTKDSQGVPHTGQITISGEASYTFAGTAYTDGSPNKFYSNDRGGIVTSEVSNIDIIKNEIYDNVWGGIHTGWLEPVSGSPEGEYTWPGGSTPAVMTIRKNKVYGNGTGTATAGGGIDVMYASGTIENNLVYENKYAGIRVGDGVLSGMTIRHNTVVDNGGGSTPDRARVGGGIVYHDGYDSLGTTPCYYCRPLGDIPTAINVKDNVIAYNSRAAFAGINFTNTVGSEERDYNLIYSNNPGAWFWSADCGYFAAGGDYTKTEAPKIDFKCLIGQYGFHPLYWDNSTNPETLKSQDPNDILDNPDFEDRANDDYRLQVGSPGDGTASDSTDRGAWGGTGTFTIPGQTENYDVPIDW